MVNELQKSGEGELVAFVLQTAFTIMAVCYMFIPALMAMFLTIVFKVRPERVTPFFPWGSNKKVLGLWIL